MTPTRGFVFVSILCATVLLSVQGQSRNNSTEVAPGITLPSTGTIYGLDNTAKGASLVQIHPKEVLADSHAGSNFARSMVYSGPHNSIDIDGATSATVFQSPQLVLYVRLGGDEPELLRDRVKILKLTPVKNRRRVTDFSMNIFGGHRSQHYDEVQVTKTEVPNSNWLKLVPQSSLEPGEYGIVFIPKDPNFFADAVYDFSVAGDPAPSKKK